MTEREPIHTPTAHERRDATLLAGRERRLLNEFSGFLHARRDMLENPNKYDLEDRTHNFKLVRGALNIVADAGLDPIDFFRKAEEKWQEDHPKAGDSKDLL